MNSKLSAVIITFNEERNIQRCIESLLPVADEIIIVDGPYEYCLSLLQKLNLFYDENNKPSKLTAILNKYSHKLKYYYKIWKDEKEKRMFGYDMCTNDLVLLVDCDEFIILKDNIINDIPEELSRACITSNGTLTPRYRNIFRKMEEKTKLVSLQEKDDKPYFASIKVNGHIFDSGFFHDLINIFPNYEVSHKVNYLRIGEDMDYLTVFYLIFAIYTLTC